MAASCPTAVGGVHPGRPQREALEKIGPSDDFAHNWEQPSITEVLQVSHYTLQVLHLTL